MTGYNREFLCGSEKKNLAINLKDLKKGKWNFSNRIGRSFYYIKKSIWELLNFTFSAFSKSFSYTNAKNIFDLCNEVKNGIKAA